MKTDSLNKNVHFPTDDGQVNIVSFKNTFLKEKLCVTLYEANLYVY